MTLVFLHTVFTMSKEVTEFRKECEIYCS